MEYYRQSDRFHALIGAALTLGCHHALQVVEFLNRV